MNAKENKNLFALANGLGTTFMHSDRQTSDLNYQSMKVKSVNLQTLLLAFSFVFIVNNVSAQVVVDGKDVTADKEIAYIQFLYFMEKGTFKPVYLIDYGLIDNQQGPPKRQKILVGKVEIKESMSPMYILNMLNRAGWEYMGDETYVHVPMMEGWYSFTLKRKK